MAASCVAITTVVPVRLIRSSTFMMPIEVAGSMFPVGSSASRIIGRLTKARAMQILAARLAERLRQEREAELVRLSGEKREVAFGNQIRTYTLAPYRLVKDERTRYETGNVDAVLDGDLDGFIEAFLQWRRARSA